jgi:uncharacterized protein (TIGR02147 family)
LISTGSEVESLAVRDLHIQMASLAQEAIKNISKQERDVSGLTMGVSQGTYSKIIDELKNFRERIIRIIAEDTLKELSFTLTPPLQIIGRIIDDPDINYTDVTVCIHGPGG